MPSHERMASAGEKPASVQSWKVLSVMEGFLVLGIKESMLHQKEQGGTGQMDLLTA